MNLSEGDSQLVEFFLVFLRLGGRVVVGIHGGLQIVGARIGAYGGAEEMIVFGIALELGFGLVVEGLVIGFFDDDGGSRSVGLPECELSLLGIVVEIALRTDSGAEVECFSFLFERELHAVSFDCAGACAIVGVVDAEGHTAVTDVDELEFVARDMEVDGVGFPFGSDEIEVIAFGVVVDVAVFPIGGVADFDEVSVAFVEGQLLCRRANASSCREEGAGEEFVELFHVDGLGRCGHGWGLSPGGRGVDAARWQALFDGRGRPRWKWTGVYR